MINFQLGWSTAHASQGRNLVENLKSVNYDVNLSTYAKMKKQSKTMQIKQCFMNLANIYVQ